MEILKRTLAVLTGILLIWFCWRTELHTLEHEILSLKLLFYNLKAKCICIALMAMIIAWLDDTTVRKLQWWMILSVALLFRVSPSLFHTTLAILSLMVFIFLSKFLPVENRKFRIRLIIGLTVILPIILVLLNFNKWWAPFSFILLRDSLQFLLVCEAFGSATQNRTWREVVLSMSFNRTVVGPKPIEDCLRFDRTWRSILLGSIWISLGILIASFTASYWLRPVWSSVALESGDYFSVAGQFLGYWFFMLTFIASLGFIDVGISRILGTPIRAPIDKPWLSVNFVEYWRRNNTYRYHLFYNVYYRNFVAQKGPWLYLGISGLFIISGLFHLTRLPHDVWLFVLKWILEGSLVALSIYWLQVRARTRVASYLRDGTRQVGSVFWNRAIAGLAMIIVLVVHGALIFMELPRF